MLEKWCNCKEISGVARDGKSTCVQCGGKDAYKKDPNRPSAEKLGDLFPTEGTFMWAVEMMKEGKKVRRITWIKEAYECCIDKQRHRHNISFSTPLDLLEDYEATDWEIYEEKKTLWDKRDESQSIMMNPCFANGDVRETFKRIIQRIRETDENVEVIIQEEAGKELVE